MPAGGPEIRFHLRGMDSVIDSQVRGGEQMQDVVLEIGESQQPLNAISPQERSTVR